MEITAKEIERQASRLKEQTDRYRKELRVLTDNLFDLQMIVMSEDSNLSDRIHTVYNHYTELDSLVHNRFYSLVDIMDKYAEDTQTNEAQTSDNLNTFDGQLQDISEDLGSK